MNITFIYKEVIGFEFFSIQTEWILNVILHKFSFTGLTIDLYARLISKLRLFI